jgi:hypothetical protein
MKLYCPIAVAVLIFAPLAATLATEDIQLGATFVCNGERIFVQSCNMQDRSDNGSCMLGHPDKLNANGLMTYSYDTRGNLKKLLPTCKQPSKEEVAKANKFQQLQSEKLAANTKKANDELDANEAKVQSAITGKPASSKEEREMTRCIASGRNPELCTGKQLDNFFGSAVNMVLPGMVKPAMPGISLAGTYMGKGGWRIDFDEGTAHTQCGTLSNTTRDYTVEIKNNLAVVTVDGEPKPILLTLKADGMLMGTGPMTIKGFLIKSSGSGSSSTSGGHWESNTTTTTHEHTALEASSVGVQTDPTLRQNGQIYTTTTTNTTNTYVPGATTYSGPTVSYIPKTENCTQAVLAAQGKAGLRMRGTYQGADGFSIEFYPDSAVMGCGQAARAYPYSVKANGSQAAIRIEDPEHPVLLAIKADGELDPGQGRYEVHGRAITGHTANGYTFAPLNATCNLVTVAAVVDPAARQKGGATGFSPEAIRTSLVSEIQAADKAQQTGAKSAAASPSAGGGSSRPATTTVASASAPPVTSTAAPSASTAGGNAILTISSGFATQPGVPNPLSGHSYILLRDSFANLLAKGGIQVPAGTSPYKMMGAACANHTPGCQKIMNAVHAGAVHAVVADASGKATFSAVAAGTYYLFISTRYNNEALVWDKPVQLKAGPNSLTLDQSNGTPVR